MLIAVSQMDSLIEELERSYADAQERMSDPAIFADHHQAADAGRRLKELEGRITPEERKVEVMA